MRALSTFPVRRSASLFLTLALMATAACKGSKSPANAASTGFSTGLSSADDASAKHSLAGAWKADGSGPLANSSVSFDEMNNYALANGPATIARQGIWSWANDDTTQVSLNGKNLERPTFKKVVHGNTLTLSDASGQTTFTKQPR